MKIVHTLPQSVNIDVRGTDKEDPVVELVLVSLFTDARASDNDLLPDNTENRRGFIGDAFSASPWGSRLWLLSREKLSIDIRNKAVSYAKEALDWLLNEVPNIGLLATRVDVSGAIPALNTLALSVSVTRPDGREININIAKLWGKKNV